MVAVRPLAGVERFRARGVQFLWFEMPSWSPAGEVCQETAYATDAIWSAGH